MKEGDPQIPDLVENVFHLFQNSFYNETFIGILISNPKAHGIDWRNEEAQLSWLRNNIKNDATVESLREWLERNTEFAPKTIRPILMDEQYYGAD